MSTNETDDNERFDCPDCLRKFDTERGMKVHHSKIHIDSTDSDYEYECPKCDFGTNSKKGFASHRSQKHDIDSKQEVECEVCGEVVERYLSEINETSVCSDQCWSDYLSGEEQPEELVEKRADAQRNKVKVECDYCGDTFQRTPKRVEKFEYQYCDRGCKHQHHGVRFSGSDHPRWSGGASGMDFVRKHIGNEAWQSVADRIRRKHNRTCQVCGSDEDDLDKRLSVHHIVPLVSGGTNADELLIPLCHDCHRTAEAYTREIVDKHLFVPAEPDAEARP